MAVISLKCFLWRQFIQEFREYHIYIEVESGRRWQPLALPFPLQMITSANSLATRGDKGWLRQIRKIGLVRHDDDWNSTISVGTAALYLIHESFQLCEGPRLSREYTNIAASDFWIAIRLIAGNS